FQKSGPWKGTSKTLIMFKKNSTSSRFCEGGNHFNKYESRNPVVRFLMKNYFSNLLALVKKTQVQKMHEIGCGEGHLTRFLYRNGYDISGSDRSSEIIQLAREISA